MNIPEDQGGQGPPSEDQSPSAAKAALPMPQDVLATLRAIQKSHNYILIVVAGPEDAGGIYTNIEPVHVRRTLAGILEIIDQAIGGHGPPTINPANN